MRDPRRVHDYAPRPHYPMTATVGERSRAQTPVQQPRLGHPDSSDDDDEEDTAAMGDPGISWIEFVGSDAQHGPGPSSRRQNRLDA
eukprot:1425907-Pyramimonas_sp.AAC.1